jgi:hypothetical protein
LPAASKPTAKKAPRTPFGRGLLLAQLTLKLFDLCLRIPESEVLHEHRLRKDINGVWPLLRKLLQKLVRLRVLLLRWGGSYALCELRKKLAFFRSHFYLHRPSFTSGDGHRMKAAQWNEPDGAAGHIQSFCQRQPQKGKTWSRVFRRIQLTHI